MSTFESLNLSPEILADIRRAGFEAPTPIQAQAIPPALTGGDVIGCAQTGTGKTAAFAIPIIERLAGSAGLRALVLAPTRELALQIQECFDGLGAGRRVSAATVIGGEAMGPQVEALRRRPAVLVATPGRLLDHLERGNVSLGTIRILVLDEADRMLDMGFAPQIERILKHVPLDRQTLCFSATMPPEMERLVRGHLVRPVRVQVGRRRGPWTRSARSSIPCIATRRPHCSCPCSEAGGARSSSSRAPSTGPTGWRAPSATPAIAWRGFTPIAASPNGGGRSTASARASIGCWWPPTSRPGGLT